MNDRYNTQWKPGLALLSEIDDGFVSEALERPQRRRNAGRWLYAAAACLAVLAAVLTASHFIKRPDDGKTAYVPIDPPKETARAETSAPTAAVESLTPEPSEPDESAAPTAAPTEPVKETETPSQTETAAPTAADPTRTPANTSGATAQPTATPKATSSAKPNPTAAPKPTNTPKPTATAKPTNTPKPTFPPGPTATPKPTVFRSEEEFVSAVLENEDPNCIYSWVTHYYRPAHVPEEAEFAHISVNGVQIAFIYFLPGYDEHGERIRMSFIWHANQTEADVIRNVNKYTVPYETLGGYYVFFQPSYTAVYWAQHGLSFSMHTPPGMLTAEDIPLCCDAVYVPIK